MNKQIKYSRAILYKHRYRFDCYGFTSDDYDEIKEWITDNCQHSYDLKNHRWVEVTFLYEEDAFAFKMRFS